MNPKLALGIGVLILLVASNAVVGYKAFRMGQDNIQADWDKAELERAEAQSKANDAILKQRPKVKHENQNRDHNTLVCNGCQRGWVRDFENCPAECRKN